MSEHDLIRLFEIIGGAALVLIGVCRINSMHQARPAFALAYVGLTVSAAGLAIGAALPQHASEWHQTVLLASVLLLLVDARHRWRDGQPTDSGSRTCT